MGVRGSVPAAFLHRTCAADASHDLVTDKTTFSKIAALSCRVCINRCLTYTNLKEEYLEGLYSVACCLSAPLEGKAVSQ